MTMEQRQSWRRGAGARTGGGRSRLALLLVALVLLVAPGARAEPAAATNRTVITSERMEFDYARLIGVFDGTVVVDSPQIRIESDKLTVLFRQDNNIKSVTAVGNVRIKQADRLARCRKAIYLAASGEVVLVGKASVQRGADLLAGEVITLWIGEERLTAEPGYLQIVPDESKSAGGLLRR